MDTRTSQHNMFDSEKLPQLFCVLLTGVGTSGLWISSPTLYKLSHPVTPLHYTGTRKLSNIIQSNLTKNHDSKKGKLLRDVLIVFRDIDRFLLVTSTEEEESRNIFWKKNLLCVRIHTGFGHTDNESAQHF